MVVQVTATGTAVSSNLGRQYICWSTPTTMEVEDRVEAKRQQRRLQLPVSNVAAGDYVLFTGSDSNNDDIICGIGEACGAYVSLDRPVTLAVNANQAGLNFTAGYMTSIGASTSSVAPSGRKSAAPLAAGVKRLHAGAGVAP